MQNPELTHILMDLVAISAIPMQDIEPQAVQMLKSKFGGSIRSKNHKAQVNETLVKVLCHNIVENHKAGTMLVLDPLTAYRGLEPVVAQRSMF